MLRNYTLVYWTDNDWFVGKLKEVPGVFSQGETLGKLIENIKDAYNLMMEDESEDIEMNAQEIEILV